MTGIKEIAREISVLVPKLIKGLEDEYNSVKDITSSQIIILMSLYETDRMGVGELAEQMGVSSPTITGLVDRLVKKDFVARKRSRQDRRKVVIALTESGEDTVKTFQKGIQKRWEGILKHLTPEERESYLRIIKKIISIVS